MPPVFRAWISPYGDDDLEWNRKKAIWRPASGYSALRRLEPPPSIVTIEPVV